MLLCILLALFSGSLIQAQHETEMSVRNAIADTLNIYEADYTAQLNSIELIMGEITSQIDNLRNLGESDQRASYFARYNLTESMEEKISLGSPIDCIAIYYNSGLLRRYSSRVNAADQIALLDYLKENQVFFTRYMSSSRSNWRLTKVDDRYYLLNIYRTTGCTILTFS